MSIAVRPEANHNALELHAPTASSGLVRIVEWAQAADAAFKLADMFVNSTMAPQAYRGKPHEAAAAILAGAELGFDPMASLRAFDNIQGTPAPKAITLRAVVQAAGHHIRIDKSSATEAVVSGLRKGDSEWQTSTWTIDRAAQMGLTGKAQWKQQPGAMLVARATAEVCRWVASDAIMGMPYSAEEIRDEGSSYEPKPPAQRVTAAEILGQVDQPIPATVAATDDAIAAGASAPWQPGEREQMAAGPVPMSDEQQALMLGLFAQAGIDQPQAQLAFMADIAGKPVGGKQDMTAQLADQVIAALRDAIAVAAQGGEQA